MSVLVNDLQNETLMHAEHLKFFSILRLLSHQVFFSTEKVTVPFVLMWKKASDNTQPWGKCFFKLVARHTVEEGKMVSRNAEVVTEELPGHEFLKLGTGEVETGPVSVCYRFVLRGTKIRQKRSHLIKWSSTNSLVVPAKHEWVLRLSVSLSQKHKNN